MYELLYDVVDPAAMYPEVRRQSPSQVQPSAALFQVAIESATGQGGPQLPDKQTHAEPSQSGVAPEQATHVLPQCCAVLQGVHTLFEHQLPPAHWLSRVHWMHVVPVASQVCAGVSVVQLVHDGPQC